MGNKNKRLEKLKISVKSSIENAAKAYSKVADKTFLFVYDEKYVEIAFLTDRFAHLTGVKLYTKAHSFYENAKNGILSIDEYGFDKAHTFENAKKKPLEILQIASWLTSESIILENVEISEGNIFDVGLTNSQSSLLFVKNTDKNKNIINNWYVPCSLRVKDSCINKAEKTSKISFIFVKEAKQREYNTLLAKDENVFVPDSTENLLSKELFEKYKNKGFSGGGDSEGNDTPFINKDCNNNVSCGKETVFSSQIINNKAIENEKTFERVISPDTTNCIKDYEIQENEYDYDLEL